MAKSKLTLASYSFWVLVIAAVLYGVVALLSALGEGLNFLNWLQSIATACLLVVAIIEGWRFCKGKDFIYKLLYFICILLVLVGIVLPLVL